MHEMSSALVISNDLPRMAAISPRLSLRWILLQAAAAEEEEGSVGAVVEAVEPNKRSSRNSSCVRESEKLKAS